MYRVTFRRERNNFVARDDNGDWRAYGRCDLCLSDTGRELAESIFHVDEIESVDVVDGVTTAVIREPNSRAGVA